MGFIAILILEIVLVCIDTLEPILRLNESSLDESV